jgi:hypothetical protein
VTNKYGKEIDLETLRRSPGESKLRQILGDLGVSWAPQWAFDETGLRRSKYDAAVFRKDGQVAFLVEYDGAVHYDPAWFEKAGVRPERCRMHVAKQMLSDARKAEIAAKKRVPLLRINPLQDAEMRSLLISWVWSFVDGTSTKNTEINAVSMFDRYGWDFDYVEPSETGKEEAAFLRARLSDF